MSTRAWLLPPHGTRLHWSAGVDYRSACGLVDLSNFVALLPDDMAKERASAGKDRRCVACVRTLRAFNRALSEWR